LLGPVNPDNSWQAKADTGFAVSHFQIDWDAQTVRCPGDQINDRWFNHQDRHGNPVIQVRFSRQACLNCPLRSHCTTSQQGARFLTLQPRDQHWALQQARQRQTTETFKSHYRTRAGVEGTISQAVHASDLRHARYRGLPKTHLQHIATAAALNVSRSIAWLKEQSPKQFMPVTCVTRVIVAYPKHICSTLPLPLRSTCHAVSPG
jgi:transposase